MLGGSHVPAAYYRLCFTSHQVVTMAARTMQMPKKNVGLVPPCLSVKLIQRFLEVNVPRLLDQPASPDIYLRFL